MWPVPITEESPILSTCMYVDKQAILVSKIAPTVIVQTVQKRLVQKKLHFCLICGLIQRVGNFSLQLLSISLLCEYLTNHSALGKIQYSAFSDVTMPGWLPTYARHTREHNTTLFCGFILVHCVIPPSTSQVPHPFQNCCFFGFILLSWIWPLGRPWWWWGFGVKLLALK